MSGDTTSASDRGEHLSSPAAAVRQVFDEALRIEAEDARFAETIRAERPDAPELGGI